MKKFISGLIIGICLMFSIGSFANSELLTKPNPFPVLVNGVRRTVDAYNINGSTYIKLSDVAKTTENIIKVEFNETTKTIEISTESFNNEIKEGENMNMIIEKANEQFQDNSVKTSIKGPFDPIIENGIEYYSLRWVEDAIYNADYRIYYNEETRSWYIVHNDLPGRPITKNKTVIENIPFKIIEGRSYIEKDYYINTILPLIQ